MASSYLAGRDAAEAFRELDLGGPIYVSGIHPPETFLEFPFDLKEELDKALPRPTCCGDPMLWDPVTGCWLCESCNSFACIDSSVEFP